MTEHSVDIDPDTDDAADSDATIAAEIERIDGLIDRAEDRLDGRIRNPENEKIRIQYMRTISTLLRTKRQYIKDQELGELAEELAELEALAERRT